MNCTECGEPVKLVPSAQARAERYGGKPSDYTRLFPTHTSCALAKRDREVRDLMRRRAEETEGMTLAEICRSEQEWPRWGRNEPINIHESN